MITYNRSAFGWRLIFRIHGSAVYRSILPAVISVLFYLAYEYAYAQEVEYTEDLLHPYAVGVLVASTTFTIVFKLNNSYGRYWEACGDVHHMISKWMDAATHTSVYHLQCAHYKGIKPPSYFDYPELDHLNMTRDRERGVDFSAFDFWSDDDDDDDDDSHHRHRHLHFGGKHTSFGGLRNRRKSKSHTANSGNQHTESNDNTTVPPVPRPARFTTGIRSESKTSSSAGSQGHLPTLEDSSSAVQLSPVPPDDDHDGITPAIKSKTHSEPRISVMESHPYLSSPPPPLHKATPKEKRKAEQRQKEIRSLVKSINYLDNSEKREKVHRYSVSHHHNSEGSLPPISASAGSFPEPISEDEAEMAESVSEFFAAQLGREVERDVSDKTPAPLLGRPRLDGNWGRYFTTDKRHPVATFYDPRHPDRMDSAGFASMQGGHTPSLFLQELAHLSSLLFAVSLSTLRNDIEGAESPLAVYVPGRPWPEVDPDKVDPVGISSWKNKIMTFLSIGKSAEERTKWNAARPLPVIGGVSDAEIRFLQMARGPYAKTQLCWNWLSEFIIREHLAGSLGDVGPPIISRIIQFLGDGMIYYNHARKIMFIPFPFVHAQLVVLFIVAMIPVIPFLMTQYTDEAWLGALLTFATVLCISGINEVARELENPFRNIPNELPLVTFQAQANEALYTMYAGFHPDFFWDGDRVLRHAHGTTNAPGANETDANKTTTKELGPSHDSIHSKTTDNTSDIADSTSKTTPSTSPVSLDENIGTAPIAVQKIGDGDFEKLKSQLAAQAKLIERLSLKVSELSDGEVRV